MFDRVPLYTFREATDVGIDRVPNTKLVFLASSKTLYVKDNSTGIVPETTIQEAITAGNLVSPQGIGGGGSVSFNQQNLTMTEALDYIVPSVTPTSNTLVIIFFVSVVSGMIILRLVCRGRRKGHRLFCLWEALRR